MEGNCSITDLAQEFGLTTRAIRFYEDVGLLTPAREGQRRVYRPRDRVRLRLILRGKRLGFSLHEIREILDLYDTPGEEAQLRHFLLKIRERRAHLRQQQEDIAVILEELDAIEAQCAGLLRQRTP
ncbi:MAG: MerR family DNA-binding transcriptional regulator [Rhodospirillales bacterium]|nr:MerR family DNA-binding transcriptional regulator [Rhodospirillales bacterium]